MTSSARSLGFGQVRPPGRRGHHGQRLAAPVMLAVVMVRARPRSGRLGHLAAHLPQPAHHRCRGRRPARPPGPGSRPGWLIATAGTSTLACVQPGTALAAAERGQQRHRLGRRPQRQFPVDAALEPVGRLAEQPVPAAHPGDAARREVGRLDHQVPWRSRDLGRQPAHRAGQRDRPRGVGDEDVLGVQGPDHVVEGLQPLPRPRPPDHDPARSAAPRRTRAAAGPSSSIR